MNVRSRGKAPHSHSGSTWFESQSGFQLPRFRFYVALRSPSKKMSQDFLLLAPDRLLPHTLQLIIHYHLRPYNLPSVNTSNIDQISILGKGKRLFSSPNRQRQRWGS